MSLLLRSCRVLQRVAPVSHPAASYSDHALHPPSKIGNREVVGFGFNGQENYVDRIDFPLPAIRFKAPSPEIQALKEKEKGDWKKLSLEEKKQLYRASFCQTLAEVDAPTGDWKPMISGTLVIVGLSIWCYIGLKTFAYTGLPETFSVERRQAQLQRMIDIAKDPIEGISSKWDYEKGDWKK